MGLEYFASFGNWAYLLVLYCTRPMVCACAFFYLTAISSSVLVLSRFRNLHSGRLFFAVIVVVFVASNLLYLVYPVIHKWQIVYISTSGWHPVQEVSLLKRVTSSGLSLFSPLGSDQCWDAPLPCTPQFDPHLGLRHPGDLGSGFIVGLSAGDSQ